jgi:predicted esterase
MHGYGRSAAHFQPVADNAAANGILAVALDGPVPYATAQGKGFAWPDDNVGGNHSYLQDALKTVTQKYNPKRVYLGGFSQGALQAAALLATHPGQYAGALAVSPGGAAPLPEKVSAPAIRRPMFLVIGEQETPDNKQLVSQCEKLWREANLPVQVSRHPDDHKIPADWDTRSTEAYKWLLDQTP